MVILMGKIAENVAKIRASLPPSVRLVAITKGRKIDEISEAIAAGIAEIGENRVQEAEGKIPALKLKHPNVVFHMVGHLQSNKAKDAVAIFDVIQSVDSLALAQKIANEASARKKNVSIMLQFRISGLESQTGYSSETELSQAVSEVRRLEQMHSPFFKLIGLMGIASRDRPEGDFRRLSQLAKSFSLHTVSAGMSNDYKIAVEEGSNMVRIGSAIFEQD
jgi:pyridoxal phosphate enzyme (YggS family)